MRLSQKQVRRLIEAEVDKMRVPAGPNSRDDGDEDFVEELPESVKLSASDLRSIINEVYMNPRHGRGIGPEVDREQQYGKLDSTKVMVMFPKALEELMDDFYAHTGPEEIQDLFGTDNPYPKDVADLWTFSLRDGVLYKDGNDGSARWDSARKQWKDE